MLVSIGIHNSTEGWHDSAGKLVSYFNWLPDEPDDLSGKQNYAGLLIDSTNDSAGWADFSSTDELTVICTKTAGQGKKNSLLLIDWIKTDIKELRIWKLLSVETKNETAKVNHEVYSSSSSVTRFSTKVISNEQFLNFKKIRLALLPNDTTEVLADDLTICEEWNLSIDLKLPNRSTKEWKNIFSLYVDNSTGVRNWNVNRQLDQRVLAVSVRPYQSSVVLMVAYNIDTSQSYVYNITKKVHARNWINLKISQMSGVYKIKLDNELVYNKNVSAQKVRNVHLLTNGKDSISVKVYYRSFKIKTCKKRGKTEEMVKIYE